MLVNIAAAIFILLLAVSVWIEIEDHRANGKGTMMCVSGSTICARYHGR